ncbi:NLRC3 [Symbiodinium sp. CCMP2592]|nr:NLRC3 [Symbiodinium sp. CCMP2592]
MAYIAGAMQRSATLEAVNLRSNSIGGSGCTALAEALLGAESGCSSLTELNLSHNPLGDEGVLAIAKVLGKGGAALRDLDLSSARSATEDAWVEFGIALSGCRLASLKLRQNPGIGDAAAEAFAQSLSKPGCSLSELDLSFCSLKSGCARILGAGHSLRQLQLFGNVAGPEAAEAFGVAAGAGAQLQDLDLSRCHLGGSAGAAMAAALRCSAAADVSLQELHLDRNALGAQGVVALAEALGAGCQLRALTLRDNRCEDTGAGAIAEALGRNRSLKELDLAGNEIHDAGGQSLGLALASSPGPRLVYLGLKSNRIGDTGAEGLAAALEKSAWLEELDLSNNSIGMVGVSKLCKALEGNTSLWSLPLEGNEAEDEVITGVEALAADVAGRRERQPPKPRFAFSEPLPAEDAEDAVSETSSEASSPASSASQVSSPSRPAQPAAMPVPRPEESTSTKEESAEDMVQLVDNFVQRWVAPAWLAECGESLTQHGHDCLVTLAFAIAMSCQSWFDGDEDGDGEDSLLEALGQEIDSEDCSLLNEGPSCQASAFLQTGAALRWSESLKTDRATIPRISEPLSFLEMQEETATEAAVGEVHSSSAAEELGELSQKVGEVHADRSQELLRQWQEDGVELYAAAQAAPSVGSFASEATAALKNGLGAGHQAKGITGFSLFLFVGLLAVVSVAVVALLYWGPWLWKLDQQVPQWLPEALSQDLVAREAKIPELEEGPPRPAKQPTELPAQQSGFEREPGPKPSEIRDAEKGLQERLRQLIFEAAVCEEENLEQVLPSAAGYDCALSKPVSSGCPVKLLCRIEGALPGGPPPLGLLRAPLSQRSCVLFRAVAEGAMPKKSEEAVDFQVSLVSAPWIRLKSRCRNPDGPDERG